MSVKNQNPFLVMTIMLAGLLVAARADAQAGVNQLYPSLFVSSDYRYQGISNSDNQPVIQGSLYVWRPDGFYAGMWVSQVDFNDPGDTSLELDTYIGRNFNLDDRRNITLTAELMYSAFNEDVPGPTYDFWQARLSYTKTHERLTGTLTGSWIPDASYGSGQVWRLESDVRYRLNNWLALTARLGYRQQEAVPRRRYASLGLVAGYGQFDFELRYVTNDVQPALCGFTVRCDAGVVGTIAYHFRR